MGFGERGVVEIGEDGIESWREMEKHFKETKENRGKKKLTGLAKRNYCQYRNEKHKRRIIYPKKAAERWCGSFSDNIDFFNFNFERDLSEAAALAVVLLGSP